ncbi:MAG: trans-acting enoyl reductase family protein [Candidatus Binatia bacterium]
MTTRVLLYGATGYTGQLIARKAKATGFPLLLAGRQESKLQALAASLGFAYRVAPLEHTSQLHACLQDIDVVLHVAGPFSTTAQPMVDTCLQRGIHYLDVSGELPVFVALSQRDAEAKARKSMLMPGVGHVIAPSDCLAAHVSRRLPGAQQLHLAVSRPDFISRGSLHTMLSLVSERVHIRRQGRMTTAPVGELCRSFAFGKGKSACTAVSWPDVFTAFYTTGIPDITVYSEANEIERLGYTLGGRLAPLLRGSLPQALWQAQMSFFPEGPSEEARRGSVRTIVAEAIDRQGRRVSSRLRTPDGYTFTGTTALAIAARVLAGEVESGFHTPGQLYGADFILQLDGVTREDLH